MSDTALFAVIPIFVGPLQVLLALLPAILVSLGGIFLALLKPATFKQGLRLLWFQKGPLLVLAALLGAGVWGVSALRSQGGNQNHQAVGPAADWPAFRGGAQRRGTAETLKAPEHDPVHGGTRWAFAAEAKTFFASPAVVGTRVYITSAERGVFTDRGVVYCLDAHSGAVLWKNNLDGFRATFSSPSIAGKHLVCGEGLHFTKDGRVICLDVTQGGKLLWEFSTHSHVESSPCIYQGRAYIGAGDDGYYCFELEPGPGGEARMVWHAPGDQFPDAETSPIVQDGKFFAGLGLGGRALICLDAATGRELWRLPTPFPVFTPPSLDRGRILFGMGNGNFVETADQAAVKELEKLRQRGASEAELAEAAKQLRAGGEVWCADVATQKVLWKFAVPEVVLGAVVPDAGRYYFGTRGGLFHCLDENGKAIATFNARSPIVASPAVGRDHVYVVTEAGRLYALSKSGLQPVWEMALGQTGPFLSSPSLGCGHVYVGTANDGLICAGSTGTVQRAEVWGGFLGGPGLAGNLDGLPLPDRGMILERFATNSNAVLAPPAAAKNLLFVPVANGPDQGVVAYDIAPGHALQPQWHFSTPHGVIQSPVYADGLVCFAAGAPGQADRFLYAVEAQSGQLRHRIALAPDAPGNAVLCGSRIFLQSRPGTLASCELSGPTNAWITVADALVGQPSIGHSILVYASARHLTAADSRSLQTLWQVEAAPLTGPAVFDKNIYLGTAAGVEAYSLLDGKSRGVTPGGSLVTPLMLLGNRLAWINAAQELMVADAGDGQVLANLPGALTNVPPVLVRDQLLYATTRGLMICRWGEFQPRLWLPNNGAFSFASPMIVANARVYFASDHGVICAGQK